VAITTTACTCDLYGISVSVDCFIFIVSSKIVLNCAMYGINFTGYPD
jgi:hypothetical protein